MDERNLPVIPIIAVITTYHWTAIIWLVTARTDPDLVTPLVSDLVQRKSQVSWFSGLSRQENWHKKKKKKKENPTNKRGFLLIWLSHSAAPVVMCEFSDHESSVLRLNWFFYTAHDDKIMYFPALSCKPVKPVTPPNLSTGIHTQSQGLRTQFPLCLYF